MRKYGGFSAPPPPSVSNSDDGSTFVTPVSQSSEPSFAPPSVLGFLPAESPADISVMPQNPSIPPKKPKGVSFLDTAPEQSGLRERKPFVAETGSVNVSIPENAEVKIADDEDVDLTAQESIRRSLNMCLDPNCTSCPPEYHAHRKKLIRSLSDKPKQRQKGTISLQDELAELSDDDDEESPFTTFAKKIRKFFSLQTWLYTVYSLKTFLFPDVALNPNGGFTKNWNQFFVWAMIVAFAVDPLFFFVVSVDQNAYCLYVQWDYVKALVVFRTIADSVYFLHMLLQFQMAYREPPAPLKRVHWWGKPNVPKNPGEMVQDKKRIAINYLKGWFIFDLLGLLPLPQVFALTVIPAMNNPASIVANLLRASILLQYIPRGKRVFAVLVSKQNTGFLFESAWASFTLNLIMYMISSHIVGALWYMGATQRWLQCSQTSCLQNQGCDFSYLNCQYGVDVSSQTFIESNWNKFLQTTTVFSDCGPGLGNTSISFNFGLYYLSRPLFFNPSFFTKYIYALQWGFLQISTFGGNQVASYFVPEVLFFMFFTAAGLLLFAVLIGNIQTFLQSLSRRSFEYQLHLRDVEHWMQRRNLPRHLAKKVRDLERLQWASNQGVTESEVLGSLTEDLQREARRHLYLELIKKSKLFSAMDEAVLDFICERLVQRIYIDGTVVMKEGFPVSRMFFVLKGELDSVSTAGGRTGFFSKSKLTHGDFFGEELLITYLEQSDESTKSVPARSRMMRAKSSRSMARGESGNWASAAGGVSGNKLVDTLPRSERTISCNGAVEGFTLETEDLEYMCRQFKETLRSPKVQRALNQCSSHRQLQAAITIQLRYRSHLRRKLKIGLGYFSLALKEKRLEGVIKNVLKKGPGQKKVDVRLNPPSASRAPRPAKE